MEQLISDERISVHRRVAYALEFLSGLRTGQVSALRWGDYEPTLMPLGKLTGWRKRMQRVPKDADLIIPTISTATCADAPAADRSLRPVQDGELGGPVRGRPEARIELRERVIPLPVRQVVVSDVNRGGAVEAEGVPDEA